MNPTVLVVVVLIAVFISGAIVMSRRQSERKKEAIADLQKEQDQLAAFDIHALVAAEVADLDLRSIAGSDNIPDSVVLKTWNQSQSVVQGCPSRDLLRYEVAPGVDPSVATDNDVTLACVDMTADVSGTEAEEPDPIPTDDTSGPG